MISEALFIGASGTFLEAGTASEAFLTEDVEAFGAAALLVIFAAVAAVLVTVVEELELDDFLVLDVFKCIGPVFEVLEA